MGWNSWNCFGVDVTDAQVRAAADQIADHLARFGWEYVVIDSGWFFPPGVTTANFKQPRPPQLLDDVGRLQPAPHKFPSAAGGAGFRPLADYLHSRGLKFGLHIMRGIPWEAVERDLPVKGSTLRAREIADPTDTCPWFHGMLGLRAGAGALAYYRSVVALFAEWGVDFIKADDMSFPYHAAEIAALSEAIREAPRPMLLSLSPGAAPIGHVADLRQRANLWRISPDFWDDWRLLHRQFSLCRAWQGRGLPGRWPDCDMLPIGKLRITGPDDYSVLELRRSADEITNEFSRLTPDEHRTLFTLWCIFRSPLFLGGFLPENDPLTTELITHAELLALNQDSRDNREVYFDEGVSVWTAERPGTKARYLAVFNLRDAGQVPAHAVRWRDLGVTQPVRATEVWTGTASTLDPATIATDGVPPHGVRLHRIG